MNAQKNKLEELKIQDIKMNPNLISQKKNPREL